MHRNRLLILSRKNPQKFLNNYFKPYVRILLIIYFFFPIFIPIFITLKWKQIVIPTLHSNMHPNTRIRITKFILIQEEIKMETKYSFSFTILVYQTRPKMHMKPIFYIYIFINLYNLL